MMTLTNCGAMMTEKEKLNTPLFSKKIKILAITGIIMLLIISIVYNLTKETPSEILTPAPTTTLQEL